MDNNKKLLFSVTKKDFIIDWYSGSGAGGQHRNKHQNCCRLKHSDSGIIITAQDSRSRKQNLTLAFNRLVKDKKFKVWISKRAFELSKKAYDIDKKVALAMREENLKIEYL